MVALPEDAVFAARVEGDSVGDGPPVASEAAGDGMDKEETYGGRIRSGFGSRGVDAWESFVEVRRKRRIMDVFWVGRVCRGES